VSYTLAEAADVLEADQKTLRKWLKAAKIVPKVDRLDARRRTITDDQVRTLATMFKRTGVITQSPQSTEAKVKALARRVEELDQAVSQIQAQLEAAKRQTHTMQFVLARQRGPHRAGTKRGQSFALPLPLQL
jgi:predicted site-specific integrase-resolvase